MSSSGDNRPQFDPQYQTEKIGFDETEMYPCPKCGRDNAPNRVKCLYCGGELELRAPDSAKLSLRHLESWEKGWNVILTAREGEREVDALAIAELVGLKIEQVAGILDAGLPLPLVRAETPAEAEVLTKRLETLGLLMRVIGDDLLASDSPPTRLAGSSFGEDELSLRDFNTGAAVSIPYGDIALIVIGEISTGKTDVLEKKRRRGNTKVLDEVMTSNDEPVVDIYRRSDPRGFRINISGFDFSCLGDSMGLYATENIKRLVDELRNRCPNTRADTSYHSLRPVLGAVWEVESRKDSRGLQRAGFGKVEFGSTSSTSNLRQFTKYSRLQWHLL